MYKEYLLKVINNNPVLTEDSPFYYIKVRDKIESMNEDECKEFIKPLLEKVHPTRKTAMSAVGASLVVPNAINGVRAMGPAGAAIGAVVNIYTIYRFVRAYVDKCSGSCGALAVNSPKRQICMAKCKVISLQKALDLSKKHKLKKEDIFDIKSKLDDAKDKLKEYQAFAAKTGRNPNPKVDPEKKSWFKIPD